MPIQGINFTSSLLDKQKISSVSEEPKVTTPQIPEEKPDEFVSTTEETEVQETTSHKTRNWAIGIGSAITLIGLFLAGRSGKLGKGIQKFLRGTEKEINHTKGNSKPRVTEAEDEISMEEFEQIKNNDVDFVVGGDKDNVVIDKEPLVIHKPKKEPASKTEDKQPAKTEKSKTQKAEEAPAPKPQELTPKQKELNAKLDRVPPKIEQELLHHEFPTPDELYKRLGIDMKEIEKIDISKYSKWRDNQIKYEMELPNKHKLQIIRTNDSKEISCIYVYDETDKDIGSIIRYTDKKESYYGDFYIYFNNIKYSYKKGGTELKP